MTCPQSTNISRKIRKLIDDILASSRRSRIVTMTHDDEQMRVHQMRFPRVMHYTEPVRGAAHSSFKFGKEPRRGDVKKIIPGL